MKKSNTLIALGLYIIFGASCAHNDNQEEKNKIESKKHNNEELNSENVLGGWSVIDVDEKVSEIAEFVLAKEGIDEEIKKITDASSQVVSGRNFRLNIHLENGEVWKAQVYENIQHEKEVTFFEKEE
ncbi:MAG: hypothetical protein MK086_11055 [Flavobacteriales bacterium]|nr:hypothetical protein [Flavobacteriales bacterium]